ncbi:MAG: DNA polymerase III subunit alpha [Firmicutes bacterium]|nr:DNA polymerase III subunit alpha [Candidatus Fiminaster equi]
MSFVPLHVYTGYSFLKSGLKIEDYLKTAKKFGYTTVGLSDFQNLTGAPSLYHQAEKAGLKVVLGEDLFIDNLLFSFYVLNEEGYHNLLKLSLKAESGETHASTIVEHNEGLAIVLTTENDVLKESLLNDEADFAKRLAKLTRGFENFYIGLDSNDSEEYLSAMREFAFTHGYKVIAFPAIKYIKKEDAIVLEMMKAIDSKEVLDYKKLEGNEYLKSPEEIAKDYTADEIKNAEDLAGKTSFSFVSQRGKMISWLKETGESGDEVLRRNALEGLKAKGKTDQKYMDRINFELDTIKKMGYSDYFLIVQDYINFAKENDIAVGPGRGSASGSLVSYALGITVPDPFEYNLLFERFLNPARQTMPDIDVDFSDIHREEIVEYIRRKYGNNRIARIMAVQKLGAKAALNDVGRIFNYEKHDIELFTKLIKDEKDDKLSLREIYKTNAQFRELVNNDKYYLEIVTLASKIEGLPRQASLHAVGVVLNAEPLEGVIPLSNAFDGGYVEQFEKDYIEEQGFLKMDVLALRNLTIVEDCLTLLKDKGIELKRDDIPYNDSLGIKMIGSAKTMGLFQLESAGMRNAIRTLKIKSFEDVVQLLALYRPGPMDSIKDFAKKKNSGLKPTYLSPALEEILAPTYGVIVYQEQIMQIASKMAGFTLGEADSFRRAVSKKDSKKLEALRSSFVTGAIKKGYKEKEATDVFNLIDKFANYGFNRSHSVVYAIFTCRMAYLKAHYPEEFYASILSNASTTEFNNTIAEMKALKIKVKCPDINKSGVTFKLEGKDILFPLSSVRGISGVTVTNILNERASGPFKDLFDFVIRMSKYRFADAQLMNLIDAGAFDSIEPSRATLRINVPNALSYAGALLDDQGLISIDPNFLPKPILTRTDDDFMDNLNREFNSLGLMVSGSPLDAYEKEIKALKAVKLDQIDNTSGDIKVVGIVKNVKKITTKKKQQMAFVTIYDDTCEKEITVFADAFEKSSSVLKKNNIVVVDGYYRSLKQEFSITQITKLEANKHE